MRKPRKLYTKMCVHCLKRRATSFTGWLLDGKTRMRAGFCRTCLDQLQTSGRILAYKGRYQKAYGRVHWREVPEAPP